jgi:hypothetical protein
MPYWIKFENIWKCNLWTDPLHSKNIATIKFKNAFRFLYDYMDFRSVQKCCRTGKFKEIFNTLRACDLWCFDEDFYATAICGQGFAKKIICWMFNLPKKIFLKKFSFRNLNEFLFYEWKKEKLYIKLNIWN